MPSAVSSIGSSQCTQSWAQDQVNPIKTLICGIAFAVQQDKNNLSALVFSVAFLPLLLLAIAFSWLGFPDMLLQNLATTHWMIANLNLSLLVFAYLV